MEGWFEKNGRVKKINIDGGVRHNNGADLKWVWGGGGGGNPYQSNFGDIKDT